MTPSNPDSLSPLSLLTVCLRGSTGSVLKMPERSAEQRTGTQGFLERMMMSNPIRLCFLVFTEIKRKIRCENTTGSRLVKLAVLVLCLATLLLIIARIHLS